MTLNEDILGNCPNCDARIPSNRLLVRFEQPTSNRVFAECPACREVVYPV